jgi:hypothetical protein
VFEFCPEGSKPYKKGSEPPWPIQFLPPRFAGITAAVTQFVRLHLRPDFLPRLPRRGAGANPTLTYVPLIAASEGTPTGYCGETVRPRSQSRQDRRRGHRDRPASWERIYLHTPAPPGHAGAGGGRLGSLGQDTRLEPSGPAAR